MTSQGVDEAALARVDRAGQHHPPGLGQPEPDSGRPEEAFTCRGRGWSRRQRGDAVDLPIQAAGQLTAEDSGSPGATSHRKCIPSFTADLAASLFPKPGLPILPARPAGHQALQHRLRRGESTVAMNLEQFGRVANHHQFLAGGGRVVGRPPDADADRAVGPRRQRPATTRLKAAVSQAARPRSGQPDHRQSPAAPRREQGHPDASTRCCRLLGRDSTRLWTARHLGHRRFLDGVWTGSGQIASLQQPEFPSAPPARPSRSLRPPGLRPAVLTDADRLPPLWGA